MDQAPLVSKLRQRATWCRELALGPCSTRLAQGLEALAREYDAEADSTPRRMGDAMRDKAHAQSYEPILIVRMKSSATPVENEGRALTVTVEA